MYFLKAAAFALTASLALVDARAISKRAPHSTSGISERGNNANAEDLKPRWINKATGEKVGARGLFGLGDDIEISQPAFQANAKACAGALDKLRKLRRKRAARAERKVRRKRADESDPEDDEDEVMEDETDVQDEGDMDVDDDSEGDMDFDDDSEDGMDLGPESHTVGMGESEFFPFENDEESTVLGTIGINSCSGVLIVGQKGAVIAHLEPISPNEGRTVDTFKQDIASKVSGIYTSNQANLAGAKMYIAVPNADNGEKGLLEKAADDLKIEKDTTQYDRVPNRVWKTEDYRKTGRGVIMVDFKDPNALKVKVFGEEKTPPASPASSDEEMEEDIEEGEIFDD
ncbi:MAG: hypothetical protein Q9172_007704 [Xanthocarpia lactea]